MNFPGFSVHRCQGRCVDFGLGYNKGVETLDFPCVSGLLNLLSELSGIFVTNELRCPQYSAVDISTALVVLTTHDNAPLPSARVWQSRCQMAQVVSKEQLLDGHSRRESKTGPGEPEPEVEGRNTRDTERIAPGSFSTSHCTTSYGRARQGGE